MVSRHVMRWRGVLPVTTAALLLAACDGSHEDGPTGPSEQVVISGAVYEYGPFGAKPLANAPLDVSPRSMARIPFAVTDAEGQYTTTASPDLEYKLRVDAPGYYQPCYAGTFVSHAPATLNASVVSGDFLMSSGIPASMPLSMPLVSGRVFERSPQGTTKPIVGALVVADFSDPDFGGGPTPAASTLSDAEGFYVLCGIPNGIRIRATAPGYIEKELAVDITPSISKGHDFELVRR